MTAPRVLITGGSSYLGQFVVRSLVQLGVVPRVAVRTSDAAERVGAAGGTPFHWDLRQPPPPEEADIFLHGAGIGFAASVGGWVRAVGAQRLVCVSSASVVVPGHPKEALVQRMEGAMHAIQCEAVVVRPTMIFGGVRDRNIQLLYRLVRRLPMAPKLVGGEHVQPVFVDDVAAVLAELALSFRRGGETLTYGGPSPLLIGDIVRDISDQTAKPVLPIPVPVRALSTLVRHSGLERRGRVAHAVTMLEVARIAPDPNSLGLRTKATPWPVALAKALTRYKAGRDESTGTDDADD